MSNADVDIYVNTKFMFSMAAHLWSHDVCDSFDTTHPHLNSIWLKLVTLIVLSL